MDPRDSRLRRHPRSCSCCFFNFVNTLLLYSWFHQLLVGVCGAVRFCRSFPMNAGCAWPVNNNFSSSSVWSYGTYPPRPVKYQVAFNRHQPGVHYFLSKVSRHKTVSFVCIYPIPGAPWHVNMGLCLLPWQDLIGSPLLVQAVLHHPYSPPTCRANP